MNEVSCAEFVELVTDFIEGVMDEHTERRFVEHLAACEGCDRYLDQFRRTIGTLGRLSPEALSAEARERLLAAFRNWHDD